MSRLFLKSLVEKVKKAPLSGEDMEYFDYLEREVVLPSIKWLILGGILMFYLPGASPGAIGTVIVILTLYLLFGLILFLRDMEKKLGDLRTRLESETILFRTDMIGKRKKELILALAGVLSAMIVLLALMVLLYRRGAFNEYWSLVSADMKSAHYALLFSVFISLAVVFTALHKITEISNLVITGEGIFISEHFLSWNDILRSEVEYFFRRPVQLILETRTHARIRIDLYRLRVDSREADQIAAILASQGKM